MTGRTLIAWRIIATRLMCAAPLVLLCAAGCSTAGTAAAAQTAAKAAAANVAQSAAVAAANTTVTVTTSGTTPTAVSTSAPKTIWGRWTRSGQVIKPDGSFSDGLLAEITFERNGSFISTGWAGVAAVRYMQGTFQTFGNVLTTKIGKLQQTMTYQIKGSELVLTNPKSHQTFVFQRG
jgi:hypothetical protein